MCFGLLILGVCWAGWLPAGAARPLKASLSVCSQISAGRTPQVLAGPLPPSLGSCPLQSTSLLLAFAAGLGQGVRVTAISPVVAPHHLSFRLCHFLILGGFISSVRSSLELPY